jgi:FkbM family methyltransferase
MLNFRERQLWRQAMHVVRPFGPFLPKRVYSHLWFQGEFRAKVHGAEFNMVHYGTQLENEVFWKHSWEHERGTVAVLLPHLLRAKVLLDIGANTGFFSLLTKAVNPKAHVVAVEPSLANFKALQRNIAINNFDICPVFAAATSELGEVTLYDYPEISYSPSMEADWRNGMPAVRVPGVTLDSLATEHRALGETTVVKIDVEGHEVHVLEGAPELIASKPVFLIEIVREHVAQGVRRLISPGDFRYHLLDENRCIAVDSTESFRDGKRIQMGNYLVIPNHLE